MREVFCGPLISSISLNELQYVVDAVVGVDNGVIAFIDSGSVQASVDSHGWDGAKVTQISDRTSFFFPGFIDTHIHASQYPNSSIFGESTLLDWLQTYTFPMEASFEDLARAREVYSTVVRRTLEHGTTTASYFASVHVEATKVLVDEALRQNQRALVGRVCMERNTVDYYKDETAELAHSRDLDMIDHIRARDPEARLVRPIITPRFAPHVSMATMQWQGNQARKLDVHIQTHLSENKPELAWVKELFPQNKSYTDVYDEAGLLTAKTVLAHAVHLSAEEQDTIRLHGSGISHCPISNSCLSSGQAPVKQYLARGLKVSLGTDVSGGYSPSILKVARHAAQVSRHVSMQTEQDSDKLTVAETLYLATQGGADVLALGDQIGSFAVGKRWDAQLVQVAGPHSAIDVFGFELGSEAVANLKRLLPKWLYQGDDRNTRKVWVDGQLVLDKDA